MLHLIFDVADRQRPNADGAAGSRHALDRLAVVHHVDARDAFRRHGVHVSGNQQMCGMREIGGADHLNACDGSGEYDLGLA